MKCVWHLGELLLWSSPFTWDGSGPFGSRWGPMSCEVLGSAQMNPHHGCLVRDTDSCWRELLAVTEGFTSRGHCVRSEHFLLELMMVL